MNRPGRRLSYAKELYYILSIVAVLLAGMFSLWGPGGYFEMRRAREVLEAQRERVQEMKKENEERYDRIEKLRSDAATLEIEARKAGFGREGEIVQQVDRPPAQERKDGKR